MATDAPISSAPSRPLPPPGTYLRALAALGRRSIPAALPALVFLWFYHVGIDLYLEMSGNATTSLGHRDSRVLMVRALLKASAYLPLLVLVYTPFLPLEDSLLRGERISFTSAIRHVLDRFVPFALTSLAQLALVMAPILLLFGILLAIVAPLPAIPNHLVAVIAVVTVVPCVIWLLVSGTFLVFVSPAVVLDDRGPLQGIRASASLVGRHFFGVVGRLLLFFVLLLIVGLLASTPAYILKAVAAVAGAAAPAFRIGAILWTSLITALTLPFWTAALLVLYRALVPAPGAAAGQAAIVGEAAPETPPAEGAGHPTPYLFE